MWDYPTGYTILPVSMGVEEHRLRVFENRVLRRIFGQKTDEVMKEWEKTA
jgi:hypothetical protein